MCELRPKANHAEAEPLLREALAIHREVLGDHRETLYTLVSLAETLEDSHEAERLYREALAMNERVGVDGAAMDYTIIRHVADELASRDDNAGLTDLVGEIEPTTALEFM